MLDSSFASSSLLFEGGHPASSPIVQCSDVSSGEHVGESVAPGGAPDQPETRAERAAREEIAARRAMRQLDPLAVTEEEKRNAV